MAYPRRRPGLVTVVGVLLEYGDDGAKVAEHEDADVAGLDRDGHRTRPMYLWPIQLWPI